MSVDSLIEGVIGREGGYSNHPADRGGPTRWGITQGVARENGYHGDMRALPREVAKSIYMRQYVTRPGFGGVMAISEKIAEELVDTGVNMGPYWPSVHLQVALNALNSNGKHYSDILEDGDVGTATLNALRAFLKKRGPEGEKVLLTALNCLQGARYVELATKRTANEAFLYGWLRTRIAL